MYCAYQEDSMRVISSVIKLIDYSCTARWQTINDCVGLLCKLHYTSRRLFGHGKLQLDLRFMAVLCGDWDIHFYSAYLCWLGWWPADKTTEIWEENTTNAMEFFFYSANRVDNLDWYLLRDDFCSSGGVVFSLVLGIIAWRNIACHFMACTQCKRGLFLSMLGEL